MSKTLKYWALAICPALLAISCEKEATLEDENPAQPQKVYRTITLEYPDDPDTRVSLAADGKTAWEAGDEILIHGQKMGYSGDEYYSRVVTLAAGDIKDAGKTATFTFEDIVADKSWGRTGYKATMFAAYPASAVANYSNGESWYYSTGFKTSNTLLLAGCNDTSVNDGNTFTFIHLSGVLSFVVDADVDSYVFSGNGGSEIVGYTTYAVRVDTQSSFGDKNDIPHTSGSGPTCAGAQTSVSGPVTADGSTVNYIYFPGGVNLSSGFTIRFLKDGDVVKYVSTNSARNIDRGKYLKLGDITSHLKTYVAPSSHDATAPAIAGATDLGASGTANCYVVNAGDAANQSKVFKFKAVKGNSSTNVGTISSVEVLWETYNDNNTVTANSVIAAVDYDKQSANDYYEICFQMPATLHAGNAVIAAKNAGGIILWSWHIWVPSSAITPIDASKMCSASLMDRNLGALEVVSTSTGANVYSLGLYYQWGRKDPFLGPKRVESGAGYALVSGTSPSVRNGSTMTINETIQNPTCYAASGISDMNLTKWASTKTEYDPCPPGYKLPYLERDAKPLSNTSSIPDAMTAAGLTWEASTTGYWFRMSDGENEVVFPLVGYVEENITTYYSYKNTIRGAVWYLCDSGSSPYHLNIRPSDDYNKFGSTSLSRGCSVRCVAE